jgi:hypothetical protein
MDHNQPPGIACSPRLRIPPRPRWIVEDASALFVSFRSLNSGWCSAWSSVSGVGDGLNDGLMPHRLNHRRLTICSWPSASS